MKFATTHQNVEAEVGAAWFDGYEAGLRDADIAMARAVAYMLEISSYGFEPIPLTAKETIQRMIRHWHTEAGE